MGQRYIFLPEFSKRLHIIGWRTGHGTARGRTGSARRGDKSHICTPASTPHSRRGTSVAQNSYVEELIHTPIERQGTEIVERKGGGHPDSVAHGLAEIGSRALSNIYLQRVARI